MLSKLELLRSPIQRIIPGFQWLTTVYQTLFFLSNHALKILYFNYEIFIIIFRQRLSLNQIW